jgi:pellino protein
VKNDNNELRECPLCRTVGPLIPIIPGIEPAFYVIPNGDDESTTSYAFHPCGHMTSQSTALYWSKIKVPYGKKNMSMIYFLNIFFLGTKGLKSICPFCSIVLSETKPFVRLIFQDSIHRQ